MSDLFRLAGDLDQAHANAARLFEIVRERLLAVLPKHSEIHHVGATSIPGCLTKGDLDILVRVRADHFSEADAVLAGLFHRNEGSARTQTFASFLEGTSDPPLGIQLSVVGGPLDIFLDFAERLRQDNDLLKRYNALKSKYSGLPLDAYLAAKADFIASALKK